MIQLPDSWMIPTLSPATSWVRTQIYHALQGWLQAVEKEPVKSFRSEGRIASANSLAKGFR